MKNIDNDFLNKYLDGELTPEEQKLVNTEIDKSSELKNKFDSLYQVHNVLNNIELDSPNQDFTNLVMNKIQKKNSAARQQKYFLFSILSLFGILIMGITGYLFYQIIFLVQSNHSTEIFTKYFKGFGNYISSIFGDNNLLLFGSILSFILLVSGYFLFEFKRQIEKKFSH